MSRMTPWTDDERHQVCLQRGCARRFVGGDFFTEHSSECAAHFKTICKILESHKGDER